ncbi:phosphatidylcholine-sterol acyltransferase isoform X2 [Pristis pectinata]|uniref:phosphatidylcholine-sterol acyltransferase isoform X2 n=1 Tax=Pristis pectinata TaxID=685728 RepID=UPI00223E6BA8|nr:phosphatidylcholine-sterol acyltransferase isoform X2 [Pristis pectinata]
MESNNNTPTCWSLLPVESAPVGPEDANVLYSELPPLIIVPGHTGNRLEAKLNKPALVHWLCMMHTKSYFTLWLNLNMFLPIGIDCWIDNIRLVYNRTTGRTCNAPGVETRVPGFGKTYSVEYLDSLKLTGYFHTLVQFLVNMGYIRDETVRAAPYDWRVAAYEQEEYFDKLKKLIEEMHMTYGKSVYLLGHSMGNLYILHFLRQQPQAWKDKFIHSFISLGAPWGGTVKSLAVLASGDNYGLSLDPLKIREQQRTTTTNPWLLPTRRAWPADHIFISTPTYNYTYNDFRKFFTDIGYEDGWFKWQNGKGLLSDLLPPGVDVYCMYGAGVPTPVTYIYDEGFPSSQPVQIVYGDGDNTVSKNSLSLCREWKNQQKQEVHVIELPGTLHLDQIYDINALEAIQDVLLRNYSQQQEDSRK